MARARLVDERERADRGAAPGGDPRARLPAGRTARAPPRRGGDVHRPARGRRPRSPGRAAARPGCQRHPLAGVIEGLSSAHRVVAPDLPGHGASDVPPEGLGADAVPGWLDELIARTCSEPATVVGHAVGGAIAARLAAHGGRVARLVLVDVLGLAPFSPAPEFGAALREFLAAPEPSSHEQLWRLCARDLDGIRSRMGGAGRTSRRTTSTASARSGPAWRSAS